MIIRDKEKRNHPTQFFSSPIRGGLINQPSPLQLIKDIYYEKS